MQNKFWLSALLGLSIAGSAGAASHCTAPEGFEFPPPPALEPAENYISLVEEIVIDRPLTVVHKEISAIKLEDFGYRLMRLPTMAGTHRVMQPEVDNQPPGDKPAFGHSAGTLVCFDDGSTVMQRLLEATHDDNKFDYLYVVWNYTGEAFEPIEHGIGNIKFNQTPAGRTVASWIYSFKLDVEKFPEYRGEDGERKFRENFLDGPFAEQLRGILVNWRVRAESEPRPEWPLVPAIPGTAKRDAQTR